MPMLSNPAFGPRVALMYVTAGALLDVWVSVYWYFYAYHQEVSNRTWFWIAGLFLTGVTLIVLGLFLGPLGRAARRAELPPSEAVHAEAAIQQTAAANPPPVGMVPPGPGYTGVAPVSAVPGVSAATPGVPVATTAMPRVI